MIKDSSTLDVWAKVVALWRNPADTLRHQTLLALQVSTGRTAASVEAALSNAWNALTIESLAPFAQAEHLVETPRRGTSLIIAPATTFTAWLPTVITCWLGGFDCRLKPSRYEPIFPAAFLESLRRVAPSLAERFQISSWRQGLPKEADVVVAFGSDDTLKKLQEETPSTVPFVGYGSKLSVAILFEESLDTPVHQEETLAKLEADLLPYGFDGCLSPQVLMVEGDQESLRKVLAARCMAVPKIHSFSSQKMLKEELSKLWPYVSTVGWAGDDRHLKLLREVAEELRAGRLCPLGEMQKPPVEWSNSADLLGALRAAPILAKVDGKA